MEADDTAFAALQSMVQNTFEIRSDRSTTDDAGLVESSQNSSKICVGCSQAYDPGSLPVFNCLCPDCYDSMSQLNTSNDSVNVNDDSSSEINNDEPEDTLLMTPAEEDTQMQQAQGTAGVVDRVDADDSHGGNDEFVGEEVSGLFPGTADAVIASNLVSGHCQCPNYQCQSKILNSSVSNSDWTCFNSSNGCPSRFSVECAKSNSFRPLVCMSCACAKCGCGKADCMGGFVYPVPQGYSQCDNFVDGCPHVFHPQCSQVEARLVCFDCDYSGMEAHRAALEDCSERSAVTESRHSGVKVRVAALAGQSGGHKGSNDGFFKPAWAMETSDLSGHDVLFDDDRSGAIMIRAVNKEYLDVMTRRADMIQLKTLKSTERSGLAGSPHYKAGRLGLRIMGGADKCKDLGATMKMARLYQNADSSHVVVYDLVNGRKVHQDEHLPADEDNGWEINLSIGYYVIFKEQEHSVDETDVELLSGDDVLPYASPKKPVQLHDLNDRDWSWAYPGLYRLPPPWPADETGIRIRVAGSSNNMTLRAALSYEGWAIYQLNGSVTIKYDGTRKKLEHLADMDSFQKAVADKWFSIIVPPATTVHPAAAAGIDLLSALDSVLRSVTLPLDAGRSPTLFTVAIKNSVHATTSQAVILFSSPNYPEAMKEFYMQYSNKLQLYHYDLYSGMLFNKPRALQGYAFPSWLIYFGEGQEGMIFNGQDVIGLAFFQTRCVSGRTDLIAFDPETSSIHRIATTAKSPSQVGCRKFLENRYCDFGRKLPDMSMLMKAFANWICIQKLEFNPLRCVPQDTKQYFKKLSEADEKDRLAAVAAATAGTSSGDVDQSRGDLRWSSRNAAGPSTSKKRAVIEADPSSSTRRRSSRARVSPATTSAVPEEAELDADEARIAALVSGANTPRRGGRAPTHGATLQTSTSGTSGRRRVRLPVDSGDEWQDSGHQDMEFDNSFAGPVDVPPSDHRSRRTSTSRQEQSVAATRDSDSRQVEAQAALIADLRRQIENAFAHPSRVAEPVVAPAMHFVAPAVSATASAGPPSAAIGMATRSGTSTPRRTARNSTVVRQRVAQERSIPAAAPPAAAPPAAAPPAAAPPAAAPPAARIMPLPAIPTRREPPAMNLRGEQDYPPDRQRHLERPPLGQERYASYEAHGHQTPSNHQSQGRVHQEERPPPSYYDRHEPVRQPQHGPGGPGQMELGWNLHGQDQEAWHHQYADHDQGSSTPYAPGSQTHPYYGNQLQMQQLPTQGRAYEQPRSLQGPMHGHVLDHYQQMGGGGGGGARSLQGPLHGHVLDHYQQMGEGGGARSPQGPMHGHVLDHYQQMGEGRGGGRGERIERYQMEGGGGERMGGIVHHHYHGEDRPHDRTQSREASLHLNALTSVLQANASAQEQYFRATRESNAQYGNMAALNSTLNANNTLFNSRFG